MARQPDWARELRECRGAFLRRRLKQRIVRLGELARPQLLSLLAEAVDWTAATRRQLWTAMYALEVLNELPPDGRTAELLVRVLVGTMRHEDDGVFSGEIEDAVKKMGEFAVSPLLAAFEAEADPDVANQLAYSLCDQTGRSEATFAVMLRYFERDPDGGFGPLSSFEDERSVPAIRADLARRRVGGGSSLDSDSIVTEACELLEKLGVDFTPRERAKWAFAQLRCDAHEADLGRRLRTRAARTDPCPCGSGREFTDCHGVSRSSPAG